MTATLRSGWLTSGPRAAELERGFAKAAYPLVAIAPNNWICLFAGSAGMSLGAFVVLNVSGTLGRLYLIRVLGDRFEAPIDDLLDFIRDYRLPLIALSIVVMGVMAVLEYRKGGGEIEGLTHLEEELGDLLFQVCFHATLAAEEGHFTLADVARGIHDKLVSRHPHVFGTVRADTAGDVMRNWDRIKTEQKGRASVMEGIPAALPSLLHAAKVQRRAASLGFDWESVDGAYPKVAEELDELRADPSEEELGDLLFAVVNVARHLDLDEEHTEETVP